MKKFLLLISAFALAPVFGAITSFSRIYDSAEGDDVDLYCVVTHVFPDEAEGFVVAEPARYERGGVLVKPAESDEMLKGAFALEVGETVVVRGKIAKEHGSTIIKGLHLLRTGSMEMSPPPPLKMSDFRKGWRHLRRNRITGCVVSCVDEPRKDGGNNSILWLRVAGMRNIVPVHVWGGVDGEASQPETIVEADGLVVNTFDENGITLTYMIDVMSANNVRVVDSSVVDAARRWRFIAIGATAAAGLLIAVFAFILLRVMREKANARLLAADRRRVAAELHDSIEQHLATAKLYLSAVDEFDDVPEKVALAVKMVENVLVHAKMEVRDAVMDLRGETHGSAKESLKILARQISAGGAVEVKTRLAAFPEDFGGARGNDIVAIAREAVTNAIKHGHAKTVAIVADGADGGFTLRVLNDGEKFDAAKALGPESGHYGLSGMKERAARSKFGISFISDDAWCGIKLDIKG